MSDAPRCVVASDKFRGSATASEIARSVAAALSPLGWQVDLRPMSDGGEGLLDVLGGEARTTRVTGPLGTPVDAKWAVRTEADGTRTAVIEMALASGLELAGGRDHNDPIAATTRGTGELVRAAVKERVAQIVVGCGGSATTDGGRGAVDAIGEPGALAGIALHVVCDVRTEFLDAASVFGPQKGASPDDIVVLRARLEECARHYVARFGVDVRHLERSGAAGGLAGGLAALGAHLESGFDYVARANHLEASLAGADLVVTGEGSLDATSFAGKVVGEILERVHPPTRVLIAVGAVGDGVDGVELSGARLVSLSERFGTARSFEHAADLVAKVAVEYVRDDR